MRRGDTSDVSAAESQDISNAGVWTGVGVPFP